MNRFRQLACSLCILCFICYPAAGQQIRTVSGKLIDTAAFSRFLEKQMDSLHMPAVSIAVFNDGKIVYHRAAGVDSMQSDKKVDDNSLFEACSLSKTPFTYWVLKTVEKGKLDLDRPLYLYLPYPDIQKDKRYKRITARMVLTHTSGFPNWRYFDQPDTALHVKYGDLYLKYPPGQRFSYSGEGFYYLSLVMAHLNNSNRKEMGAIFHREVAVPLDLKYAYYSWDDNIGAHKVYGHHEGKPTGRAWPTSFPTEDSSMFGAAGALHTEAVSYATFLIALMDGKGLKKETLQEMLKEQVQLPADDEVRNATGVTAWGLSIGIEHSKYGILYRHGGNNGAFQSGYLFYRPSRCGYVFFTNCERGAEFEKRIETFFTEEN